jgi:protein-S-isoprenylcysteine O-methyltransferase Ste14
MKQAKVVLYALAGAIFLSAVVLFFIYTIHDPMTIGEGGEVLGWVLGGSMVPLFCLFVMRRIFLNKKTKPETKKKLVPLYGALNQLHLPIGSLSVALMWLHFVAVFNIRDPSYIHFITGYVLIGLMALLVALGFSGHFQKDIKARSFLTWFHVGVVVALIATFIVHLILK